MKTLKFCIWSIILLSSITGVQAETNAKTYTKVAVVDMSEVMKNYRKVLEYQHAVDQQFVPRQKSLDEEQKKIVKAGKHVKRLREKMNKHNPALFDEAQKFERMVFIYEKHRAELSADMVSRMRKDMRVVLNDIRAAINKVATNRGIHIVMRSSDKDNLLGLNATSDNPGNPSAFSIDKRVQAILQPHSTVEVVGRFKRNPVLYGSNPIDITKEVIASLNATYAKTKRP